MTTILKLRDKAIPFPKGEVCLSPCTDMSFSPSQGETDPILADAGPFWLPPAFLGKENRAELQNPLVSPLFADLRGFPPLLVQATSLEILFEESRQLVERVEAAEGEATLQTLIVFLCASVVSRYPNRWEPRRRVTAYPFPA